MLGTLKKSRHDPVTGTSRGGTRPPGPRRRYPGQFIRALATDRLGLFAEMARHGDVTQISIRARPVVLLMHPGDIRRMLVTEQRSFIKGPSLGRTKALLGNGLLTNEGESHLRQRRLVQPAFHRERLATYASLMVGYAERTAERWAQGETVDVHEAMMRLTLAVAARAFFDADVEGDAHYIGEALDLSLRLFGYAILPLGGLIEYTPLPWVRDLHRSRRQMDGFIERLIRERRSSGEDRGDLLSMLIAARDTEGDGGGMTDRQLRDEIVTLLMAGHETTANALSWSWLMLSRHPHVEAKLHDSLDLRRLLVIGAAGWETKFATAALEERGWEVDAHIVVSPGTAVRQGRITAIDTTRYSAVLAVDTTAARYGDRIARFVRMGGGLVLWSPAAEARALTALAAGAPGLVVEAPGHVPSDSAPRAAVARAPIISLAPDAVALERQGGDITLAARRIGAGRVIQTGYIGSWRWRMAGGEGAPARHRAWLAGLVARVAYTGRSAVAAPPTDAAPLATLIDRLGPAAVGRDTGAAADPAALARWVFAILCLALFLEWASRRTRGVK